MMHTCYTRYIIGYLNGLRLVNFIETAAVMPVKILYSNPVRAGHASSCKSVTYIGEIVIMNNIAKTIIGVVISMHFDFH